MTYSDAVRRFRRRIVEEVTSLANHDQTMLFFLIQHKLHLLQSRAQGARLHTVMSMTATQSEDRLLLHTTYWWLLLVV